MCQLLTSFQKLAGLTAALALTVSCTPQPDDPDYVDAGESHADAMEGSCDPTGDDDGDCIPNSVEGCLQIPAPDHDGDNTPDYIDIDADGDGIRDALEVGNDCENPRDNDGDGTPDYLDADSDNDGVNDSNEDRNGDGVVGTCTLQCTQPSHCPFSAYCSMPGDGSGYGTCVELSCMGGETDPHNQDSDGDGVPDGQEGTYICNPATETNPFGLKPIKYVDSADTAYPTSNWRLALELSAIEGTPSIANPTLLNAAYTFDMIQPNAQVAGFLASRPAGSTSAVNERDALLLSLQSAPFISSVTVRVSGSNTTSLDGYDTVLGTTIEITTTSQMDVTGVRELVLPVALARPAADVTFPPAGWVGTPDNRFIVTVQTIRRAAEVQTLFVGAVARAVSADDPTRTTPFHLDDMSNGTGVSVSGNGEEIECEQFVASQQASADIIWIVDESGSTSTLRDEIASNASLFFQKAVAAGLDFRLGVTDMNDTNGGLFATRAAGGTGDRWLLPNEQALFEADIADPSGPDAADGGTEHGLTQGRAVIMRHLPRDNTDPQKIREGAKLVVIYVTDEQAEEVEDAGILGEGNTAPTPAELMQIETLMAPYIADFIDNDATAHLIAELLPHDTSACGAAEHAYGYYSLVNATGGQQGSICQPELDATMDALIDDIIGGSSPIVLSKFPISASIAVSRDAEPVARSRQMGFDYRASANSIVFYNQPFSPANPSDIVVSYRRWKDQVPVD